MKTKLKMIKWFDSEADGYKGGFLNEETDEIICGCCGAVFPAEELRLDCSEDEIENTIIPLSWADISDCIMGED